MSEAKELFVEHLRKTHPVGQIVGQKLELTSTLTGVTRRVIAYSRITVGDVPGRLPKVRKQVLSRVNDDAGSRFLLDQTIDLNTSGGGQGGDATRIWLRAWDADGERTRPVPANPFLAFPGTSIRLLDYLLPLPEYVAGWGVAAVGDRKVLELALRSPVPPPFDAWLTPQATTTRLELAGDDLRMLVAEVLFADGSSHRADVGAWTDGAFRMITDVTVRDGAQATRTWAGNAADTAIDHAFDAENLFSMWKLEHWS